VRPFRRSSCDFVIGQLIEDLKQKGVYDDALIVFLSDHGDIRQAYTWYRDGREEEALSVANHLLAGNEQIADVWDLKSKILYKMGRRGEAIEAAKEGLRHAPTAGVARRRRPPPPATRQLIQFTEHSSPATPIYFPRFCTRFRNSRSASAFVDCTVLNRALTHNLGMTPGSAE
jgi:tetratricopeptide (TPR) repeat protein